jgi:hypothetical protein
MNNSSIFTADRTTHLKIVVVSLIASIVVVAVGITARQAGPETASIQASAPIVKAGKPVMATTGAGSTIR